MAAICDPARMGLSVVIPTLDAAASLGLTLESLAEAEPRGLALEVIVSDGGSGDATLDLAARAGARVVTGPKGRGRQLAAGAAAATGTALLFLHADTRLEPGWAGVVTRFLADPKNAARAGYFRLMLDDADPAARRLERLVAWRCRRLGLPYGDQGLLLSRALYDSVGGYRPLPLMEDVDLVRRLGAGRLVALPAAAITSAARYARDGYLRRSARNLFCLTLYWLGVPPRRLVGLYG